MPLLYGSLLRYDPSSGRMLPGVASAWQVAPDSRTITFTLHTAALWSGGAPVTADDVRFSLLTALDPALDSLYGANLQEVAAIDVPAADTVVVRLAAAECPALAHLGEVPIIPAAWAGRPAITATLPLTDVVPGTGPFLVDSASSASEIRFVRNRYALPSAFLDGLTYRAYDSAAALQSALAAGAVDVAWFPDGAPEPGDTPESARITDVGWLAYPAPHYLAIAFNIQNPLLADTRMRQALSLAIDRAAIRQQLTGDDGTLVAGSLPPFHWAADSALAPPPYDPAQARDLLAEDGWRDADGDGWLDRQGKRMRLPVRTNDGNPLREEAALLVAGYYRALGVEAAVEIVSWASLANDLFTHDFGVVVFGWPLAAEPDQRTLWLSTENEVGVGLNVVSFADAEVDRLLVEAASLPGCAPEGRVDLYRSVQVRLADARPYDHLLVPPAALAIRDHLAGPAPGPYASPFWNAAAWHLRAE